MTFLIGNSAIKNVSVADINLNNTDYKISKDFIDDKLVRSIESNGILDPPVLIKENNSYIIIAGHNRLHVLNQLERKKINSFIVKSINHKSFIQYAILKNYRNEAGYIGKIRFVGLLKNKFHLDEKENYTVLKQLQIPAEILQGKDPWDKTANLTNSLRNYIDSKDFSFKNIKAMLRLPEYAINLISDWVSDGMRVNIFKGIVEMVFDIIKRDKSLKGLQDIDLNNINDRKKREESIFNEVFNARYPEYSEIRSKADYIIKKINASGIDVNFPEYFEGDEIGIYIKINKRESFELFQDKLAKIDMNLIKGLFNLL